MSSRSRILRSQLRPAVDAGLAIGASTRRNPACNAIVTKASRMVDRLEMCRRTRTQFSSPLPGSRDAARVEQQSLFPSPWSSI